MESKNEIQGYLDNVNEYLALDFEDLDQIIKMLEKTEPIGRVQFDDENGTFVLGMAAWPSDRIRTTLKEIRDAILSVMDGVAERGRINRSELQHLSRVYHDLSIQHIYSDSSPTGLKLSYNVPDSKIAWEEGKCPHCGETVTIHLFPDPVPVFAYEALINTLRLLTRGVPIGKAHDTGRFQLV